ncbi:MAG: FlgD immunoglobulin-like domain containing protein [bacterium]
MANAGSDQTVECSSFEGTEVTLDGTASSDPDGDPLTYRWTWDSDEATGPTPTISLPVGTTTVTLMVNDGTVDSEPNQVDITVEDTTPAVITVQPPITLWPPNHKYVAFGVEELVADVSDACSGSLSISGVNIISVSSDEPEDAKGNGDGKTTDDIVIAQDCKSVKLRKESQGGGNGRVYAINLEISDANGNVGAATCLVTVPHNQNGTPAIDDGPEYTVVSDCGNMLAKFSKHQNEMVTEIMIQEIPENYALFQNYPNPFNPETNIRFALPKASHVVLKIYNTLGQEIRTFVDTRYETDYHSVHWDGKDNNGNQVSSGIYLYQLQVGEFAQVKKMSLIR